MEWLKAYNHGGSHYPYLTTAKGETGFVLSGFTNFYVPHFSPMIIKLDDNFESGCNETDYTNLTFQEYMPAKVKTPAVLLGSGGSLITTNVEAEFVMNDTVLCSSFSDSCFVFTGMQEITHATDLPTIYPNPTSGQVTIEFFSNKNEKVTIDIINDIGGIVLSFNRNISAGESRLPMHVEELPAGLFIVRISGGEKYPEMKFIKE
jgi:hypothetical protein